MDGRIPAPPKKPGMIRFPCKYQTNLMVSAMASFRGANGSRVSWALPRALRAMRKPAGACHASAAGCAGPIVASTRAPANLKLASTRSSGSEVRIRVPDLFSVDYFRRIALPQKRVRKVTTGGPSQGNAYEHRQGTFNINLGSPVGSTMVPLRIKSVSACCHKRLPLAPPGPQIPLHRLSWRLHCTNSSGSRCWPSGSSCSCKC